MTVNLTLRVPEGLLRQAKAVAALRGDTLSAILRARLEEYVAQCRTDAKSKEAADWQRLGSEQFFAGYADADAVYDSL